MALTIQDFADSANAYGLMRADLDKIFSQVPLTNAVTQIQNEIDNVIADRQAKLDALADQQRQLSSDFGAQMQQTISDYQPKIDGLSAELEAVKAKLSDLTKGK